MHFTVYLSPLRGEMSRTKSTRHISRHVPRHREETGESERRQIVTISPMSYRLWTDIKAKACLRIFPNFNETALCNGLVVTVYFISFTMAE